MRLFALRAIQQCDGNPMPWDALDSALAITFPPALATATERAEVVDSLERDGFIASIHCDLTGLRLCSLTPKGTLALVGTK